MGSQQSKPVQRYTGNNEKMQLITERLRALPTRIDDNMAEDDYVQIYKTEEKGSKGRAYRKSTSMSVSVVERWQETLLQSPKNRQV